ncbi:hypothetical protein IV203_009554 [Nitzschia inconspicua]|uniref:Uncharacterized protein n=1 Tax=Nitzschia inconspicua TaxID=303405 RepID=A0A9K3KUI3_9STRA|nr:hypothetical protein IV203_009554 [Nitzschia inconspicua]
MLLKEIWKTETIGLKLGFYRCNAAKIAKNQVRKSRRHQHGNLSNGGEIKRKQVDWYMVDCVVTGSDQAPQMPHANDLDLAIFPSMSHRHSSLISEYSNTEAPAVLRTKSKKLHCRFGIPSRIQL